jgi:hypothetical protein
MNFLVKISEHFDTLSSRGLGEKARTELLSKINEEGITVTLDFNFESLSPSFADEFIGIVAFNLGLANFKKKIKMINLNESSKSIIKHVIGRRISEKNEQESLIQ